MIESQKPWGDGEYAIAHLSDLHFGSKNYKEVWKLTAQHLEAIKPDLLLVTGDLVDTPKKRLYAEVKESLENLRIPYHVCAGNHDRFYHGNQFPLDQVGGAFDIGGPCVVGRRPALLEFGLVLGLVRGDGSRGGRRVEVDSAPALGADSV